MQPLIDTAEGLAAILPLLAAEQRIAVDTEADSLHSYFEKLCLIQISIPGHDFLVDPLAGYSLQPLFDVWQGKELVLHGADYDLRLFRRSGFARPTTMFDTSIAARLTGGTEFSLAALLQKHFDLQISKASQKANWARRPLSPQMTDYAVNDTRYLLKLADIYKEELCRLGRWTWFEQSCERAIQAAAVTRERDPESLWRISGSHELSERGSAILRALWHWRDQEAQQVDRPTFHILNNDLLLQSASRADAGERVSIQHLRGGRLRRFEESLEAALALPKEQWPKFERKARQRATTDQEAKFRSLKQVRDKAATDLKIDPSLIAPKATLERLAYAGESPESLLPWQRQVLAL